MNTTRTAQHRLRLPALVALPALALTLSAAAVPATSADATTKKPTIVLVHGAFADSSSWNGTVKGLQKAGFPVIAAANPLRDLTTDSAYVGSLLDTIKGPVILVGHSYGGMVISNVAAGRKNVKALVYVAAFAPKPGESALALSGRFPGSKLPQSLIPRPYPLPGGGTATDLYINPAKYREAFSADLPASVTKVSAVTQRPASTLALGTPSKQAAWTKIPSWFLVAGKDNALPPAAQRFMAKRAGAHTFEVKQSSHVVMISHPGRTVAVIKAAYTTTR